MEKTPEAQQAAACLLIYNLRTQSKFTAGRLRTRATLRIRWSL
jgi:hypothetical protein